MWSQLGGEEDGGRSVGTTDDTDGCSFLTIETKCVSSDEGDEDAQLSGSTEEEALRIGNQWTEVGHRTYTDEDEARIDTGLHTNI